MMTIILIVLLAISFAYNMIYRDVIKTLKEDVNHYYNRSVTFSSTVQTLGNENQILKNKINNLEKCKQSL